MFYLIFLAMLAAETSLLCETQMTQALSGDAAITMLEDALASCHGSTASSSRWKLPATNSVVDLAHEQQMEHIWPNRDVEFVYTARPDELQENSGDEPNHGKSSKSNSPFDVTEEVENQCPAKVPSDMQHQLCSGADSPDERRLGLLDTACTSCMHSRAWREAYAQHLPPHLTCQETPPTKSFTFVDGSSTDSKMVVWRIPLLFGGHPGEVYAAEVETGNTPLLLSIPAMEALDMSIFLTKKEVHLGKLGISLPLVVTRTRHLAVDLLNAEGREVQEPVPGGKPVCQSEKDDLFVYLTEEASYKLGIAEADER